MLTWDNAKKTGDCVVWYKICVTCMNVLVFLHSFIFVSSHKIGYFQNVVVDNLTLCEPPTGASFSRG